MLIGFALLIYPLRTSSQKKQQKKHTMTVKNLCNLRRVFIIFKLAASSGTFSAALTIQTLQSALLQLYFLSFCSANCFWTVFIWEHNHRSIDLQCVCRNRTAAVGVKITGLLWKVPVIATARVVRWDELVQFVNNFTQ